MGKHSGTSFTGLKTAPFFRLGKKVRYFQNYFKFNAHPNDPSGTILATNHAVNYWVDGGLPAEKLVWFSN